MAFRVHSGSLTPEALDTQPVQPLRPLVEVFSSVDQELEVVQAGMQLAEALPPVALMADEAEDELSPRLDECDVAHPSVGRGEVVQHLQVQQGRVPRRARSPGREQSG